jgi:hypothetical protein
VTAGEAAGVCFFRQVERGGLRWLLLQDMLLRSPDPKIAAELVRNAQRTFKPDFMTAFVPPGSFERRALRACGFRWTLKGGSNFVANALAPDLPLDPTRLASWSLSLCDLEFF